MEEEISFHSPTGLPEEEDITVKQPALKNYHLLSAYYVRFAPSLDYKQHQMSFKKGNCTYAPLLTALYPKKNFRANTIDSPGELSEIGIDTPIAFINSQINYKWD